MPRSFDDIAHDLTSDTSPGADGCSNADRITYIGQVFGHTTIRLGEKMDFSHVPACTDIAIVNASKHLALLQLDFLKRSYDHYLIEIGDFQTGSATLILDIQRMNWHLQHLQQDVPTPPFPYIH